MIKVFTSDNINRNDVIALWKHAFGDSEEYISFFLENCPDYLCFEYFEDGRLASMFFLLEGELGGEKCKYLYAACTHTEYRKRGIMEKLIEYAKKYCSEEGYSSVFLVPANEKLYSYYSKFGFVPSFSKKTMCLKCSPSDVCVDTTYDVDEIVEIKKLLTEKTDCFRFSDEVMKYTVKEHLFNKGKVFLNTVEGEKAVAFYYEDGNNVFVKEFLSENKDISENLYKEICNKNTENIYICTPLVYNSRDIVEKYTKCGMCFPLNKKMSDFLEKHTDLYAGMYLD